MFDQLFPRRLDNTYRGYQTALWLLAIVVTVKVLQVVGVMLDGPGIIQGADGIPLDTFSPEASRTIVAAFVGMGISRLFISVVCAAALWRYRSALPVILGLLAMHDIARELVLHQVRLGTPIGPIVNAALVFLTLAGLALSVGSGRGDVTA